MHPPLQVIEVRKLPLKIRVCQAAEFPHRRTPFCKSFDQFRVVGLRSPLFIANGPTHVGVVRYVDDDVVHLATP